MNLRLLEIHLKVNSNGNYVHKYVHREKPGLVLSVSALKKKSVIQLVDYHAYKVLNGLVLISRLMGRLTSRYYGEVDAQ